MFSNLNLWAPREIGNLYDSRLPKKVITPMDVSINIAIVEDSDNDASVAEEMLNRYAKDYSLSFNLTRYNAGGKFLSDYKNQFDFLILDINLDASNGIEIARRIREKDEDVLIMFMTNLAKYATYGYEVGAIDFVLKPLSYPSLSLKLDRVMKSLLGKKHDDIVVPTGRGFVRLRIDEILYVEIFGHDLVFHLLDREEKSYGTLKQYEEKLSRYGYYRCNSCYLVGSRQIQRIEKYDVLLRNGETIKISHPKRKAFLANFKRFILEGDDAR